MPLSSVCDPPSSDKCRTTRVPSCRCAVECQAQQGSDESGKVNNKARFASFFSTFIFTSPAIHTFVRPENGSRSTVMHVMGEEPVHIRIASLEVALNVFTVPSAWDDHTSSAAAVDLWAVAPVWSAWSDLDRLASMLPPPRRALYRRAAELEEGSATRCPGGWRR